MLGPGLEIGALVDSADDRKKELPAGSKFQMLSKTSLQSVGGSKVTEGGRKSFKLFVDPIALLD
jgi:hypothetical protein